MDTPGPTASQTEIALDPGDQPLSPDEEIAGLEQLLTSEPDDFQARCRLGELYFSKGRLDDALAEVKKSIEMAESLRAGDVVAIDGELGAGKTRLVRGGLKRSANGETSEALYLTQGYVYASA